MSYKRMLVIANVICVFCLSVCLSKLSKLILTLKLKLMFANALALISSSVPIDFCLSSLSPYY
jgi:hypothetical protein